MIKYHSKSVNNMDTGLDPEKECPICFEEYSRFCADCPSIINKFTPFLCNHSLCANCFERLLTQKDIRCPLCRATDLDVIQLVYLYIIVQSRRENDISQSILSIINNRHLLKKLDDDANFRIFFQHLDWELKRKLLNNNSHPSDPPPLYYAVSDNEFVAGMVHWLLHNGADKSYSVYDVAKLHGDANKIELLELRYL